MSFTIAAHRDMRIVDYASVPVLQVVLQGTIHVVMVFGSLEGKNGRRTSRQSREFFQASNSDF